MRDKNGYNLIYNADKDISIGYWTDLITYITDELKRMIIETDWNGAYRLIDSMREVDKKLDPDKLYIMSDNNGMGLTIEPYTGENNNG